jgi:hypothetical protein
MVVRLAAEIQGITAGDYLHSFLFVVWMDANGVRKIVFVIRTSFPYSVLRFQTILQLLSNGCAGTVRR